MQNRSSGKYRSRQFICESNDTRDGGIFYVLSPNNNKKKNVNKQHNNYAFRHMCSPPKTRAQLLLFTARRTPR